MFAEHYNSKRLPLYYTLPTTRAAVVGAGIALCALLIGLVSGNLFMQFPITAKLAQVFLQVSLCSIGFAAVCAVFTVGLVIMGMTASKEAKIGYMLHRALFCASYGNPLHFRDGEILPKLRCRELESGTYEVVIGTVTAPPEVVQGLSSIISAALNHKGFRQLAVTQSGVDPDMTKVTFTVEDVTIDKSLVIKDVKELTPTERTKFIIQQGSFIDLTTSGSMLVAGKTRSGKTTGIISILLQALLAGRDVFGSLITIIDPKQAELSRLPHVVTLDENGEATAILDAIRAFVNCIVKRQKNLNDLSEQSGDAVKWDAAGMQPSFLFIDEYVSVRTMFPTKADKERPDYSLATFDALIKRIVTMGASAGCFVIISIAEASVAEGGLPAMLRSAMSTKILFKPTLTEGRLLWDSDKLETLNTGRTYNAGDAWFSSTDGIHDNVSYVHFPRMEFPVYRELGALLERYYQ